jgi:hypothetical protein
MLTLLERNIAAVDRRLVLLAPQEASLPQYFKNVTIDRQRHRKLVREMQRLRGGIYLQDGALQRDELSSDGLHHTLEDERSWHLLMLNCQQQVNSCVWYLPHGQDTEFEDLRVRNCPLAGIDAWRDALGSAVQSELARARRERLRYAEVGGWAVTKESRCTSEGLLLALAAYSLGRIFGEALGITTATVRHASSTILRRLGGSSLEFAGTTLPKYYDPKYKCEMELLRFDSRRPNAKYAGLIEVLKAKLANVAVVATEIPVEPLEEPAPYELLPQEPQPQFA